jgi:hypothetical protein
MVMLWFHALTVDAGVEAEKQINRVFVFSRKRPWSGIPRLQACPNMYVIAATKRRRQASGPGSDSPGPHLIYAKLLLTAMAAAGA